MGWGVAGKPNILLIMADQHQARVLGCNGDPAVYTPHIDRLAGEGANVTEMHCQAPSRLPAKASVLLERYVRDHGVVGNRGDVPRDQPTFLHALQDEGYHTGSVGPMHFWVPETSDRATAGSLTADRLDQMHSYGFDDPHGNPEASQRAARWIEEYDDDEPWFMWIGLPGPRDGGEGPAPSFERYADVEILAARRGYYANVTIADEAVGVMRTALEESHQLDDTWIIYTSGHGATLGDQRATTDRVLSDEVTRVPLLVRPPGGASEATTVNTLTEAMDLSATIRAIAGATGRRHFEGRSLLPQFDGSDPTQVRDAVFSQNDGVVMARTERHKIIVREDSLTVRQLFDLEADPHEAHNLAGGAHELAESLLAAHIRPFLENGRTSPDPFG